MARVLTSAVLWLALLLAVVLPSGHTDDHHHSTPQPERVYWNQTPREWKQIKHVSPRGYADPPDPRFLETIGVEWRQPRLDALGNYCDVGARLSFRSGTDPTLRPIDWYQVVSLYASGTPEVQPDWSGGITSANSTECTLAVSHSGAVRFRIDLRELERDSGRPQSYQFGLALAQQSIAENGSLRVISQSSDPVLPASVRLLEFPAAPKLATELGLINEASGWPFSNRNGVALIRTVNALHQLGKHDALSILEQYLQMAQYPDYFSEREIVFWIIRALFEPIHENELIPSPAIAVYLVNSDSSAAVEWPLRPMTISHDVPFMVGHQINMGGMPEDPTSHIEWARQHCVLRAKPLMPSANPLAAAEAILSSSQFKQLEEHTREAATASVRAQAVAMTENLLTSLPKEQQTRKMDDALWQKLLAEAANLAMQWDPIREAFVVGNK